MSSFAYIQNLRLPHEMAHSVAVVKAAEAASSLFSQSYLVHPRRQQPKKLQEVSVFQYYGLSSNQLGVVSLPVPELLWLPIVLDRIYSHFRSLVLSWSFALQAWWFAKQHQIAVIQTGDREIMVLLRFLSWLYRPKLIYDLHNDFADRYNKTLLSLSHKAISLAVVNCSYLESYVKQWNPDLPILVEPNGYDPIHYSQPAISRSQLGISRKDFVIGYVGRLETMGMEKGVGLLLTSVATLIHKRGLEIKVLLVGGPDQMLEKYRQLAKKVKIDTSVICVPQVPQGQVARYMKVLDLGTLLYPDTHHYRLKMSPMKAIEYAAAGCAMVASDLPTLRQLLGDLAWYVPAGNIKALNKVIEYGYHHKKESQKSDLRAFAKSHTWKARQKRIITKLGATTSLT